MEKYSHHLLISANPIQQRVKQMRFNPNLSSELALIYITHQNKFQSCKFQKAHFFVGDSIWIYQHSSCNQLLLASAHTPWATSTTYSTKLKTQQNINQSKQTQYMLELLGYLLFTKKTTTTLVVRFRFCLISPLRGFWRVRESGDWRFGSNIKL